MNWIKLTDRLPELNKNILVIAKEGYYWPEVHGKEDERIKKMHVGYFYDDHECFKKLKPKIEFKVDCGCFGWEYDRANLEVLYWMPVPELPKDE